VALRRISPCLLTSHQTGSSPLRGLQPGLVRQPAFGGSACFADFAGLRICVHAWLAACRVSAMEVQQQASGVHAAAGLGRAGAFDLRRLRDRHSSTAVDKCLQQCQQTAVHPATEVPCALLCSCCACCAGCAAPGGRLAGACCCHSDAHPGHRGALHLQHRHDRAARAAGGVHNHRRPHQSKPANAQPFFPFE